MSRLELMYSANNTDNVVFHINLNTFSLLYSDFLLLVLSAHKYLQDRKIGVSVIFIDFKSDSKRAIMQVGLISLD